MQFAKYGVTFNDWVEAHKKNGTEWLEDQLMVLEIALENAKQVDKHNATPESTVTYWEYNK